MQPAKVRHHYDDSSFTTSTDLPPSSPRPATRHQRSRATANSRPPQAATSAHNPRPTLLIVYSSSPDMDPHPQVRDNLSVDPVVIALAQLIRDRWTNEHRARTARRSGLTLVPSNQP